MGKILQEFFPESFVLAQQFDFFSLPVAPSFYIFPYFFNAFFWKNILEIDFFFSCGLGLVNEFINQFDFPVDKFFERNLDEEIGTGKYQYKCTHSVFPAGSNNKNTN